MPIVQPMYNFAILPPTALLGGEGVLRNDPSLKKLGEGCLPYQFCMQIWRSSADAHTMQLHLFYCAPGHILSLVWHLATIAYLQKLDAMLLALFILARVIHIP